jgi:hypothetical protein
MQLETIGETEAFYGYITGLGIHPCDDDESKGWDNLYASFEYGGETKVWIVPDTELFNILASFLKSMAWERHEGCHGMSKLWIAKQNGKWIVDLP